MNDNKLWAILAISEENTVEIVGFDDYHVTLDNLYRYTDCDCIQIVNSQTFQDILICIDDNGKLVNKDVNILATCLYGSKYDFLVGKAVIGTSQSPYPYQDEPDIFAMPYDMAVELKNILEQYLKECVLKMKD